MRPMVRDEKMNQLMDDDQFLKDKGNYSWLASLA
jgi:hypothetical protein